MLTKLSPLRRFIERTPRAVRPKGRNSPSAKRKWIVIPAFEPISTLSPGIDNRTQVSASPSSKPMAIKPLERMLLNAERRVRLMKPPWVSINKSVSSLNSETANNEVIASSRGMGNSCTTGVPLAVRLHCGTR